MNMQLNFIDNPAATDKFTTVTIDAAKALQSWRLSILSHEWLTAEGEVKKFDRLSDHQQRQFMTIAEAIKNGEALIKPILGIGIMDNIEIGSERGTFVALIAQGIESFPVHIPSSNADEFKPYIK